MPPELAASFHFKCGRPESVNAQRVPDADPNTDVGTPGVAGDTGASGDWVMVLGLDELKVGPGCAGTLTTSGGAEDRGEDADEPAAWPPVWACAPVKHRPPITVAAIRPRSVLGMMVLLVT